MRVLVAVGGGEAALVAALSRQAGVEVTRRCADVADLLAGAAAGLGSVALVSADLRGLDRDVVARLAATGVGVVGVVDPADATGAATAPDRTTTTTARGPGPDEDAERHLRRLGVGEVVVVTDVPAVRAAAERAASEGDRAPGGRNLPTEPDLTGAAELLSGAGGPADSPADSPADVLTARLRAGLRADPGPLQRGPGSQGPGDAGTSDPARALVTPAPEAPLEPVPPLERTGRLVAVWGPHGAPGRTTVAVHLAGELAARGERVLLADADPAGGAVAQVLGLLDDAAGLATACRAASQGALDLARLNRLAPEAAPGLRVLTGLTRGDRWPELRASSLEVVWDLAHHLADWTVVDCGAGVERDEEAAFDGPVPRRDAATLATLEAADVVLAVGRADPVGLQRLVRGLADLAAVTPTVPVVVVTRLRAGAVGPRPERRVRDALARYAGVEDLVVVPEDQEALDAALLAGATLAESQRSSAAAQGLATLADRLAGPGGSSGSGRRRGSRRGGDARRTAAG